MNGLYSYNQLEILKGKNNQQVKAIDDFISSIGECYSNRCLEAFRLLEEN